MALKSNFRAAAHDRSALAPALLVVPLKRYNVLVRPDIDIICYDRPTFGHRPDDHVFCGACLEQQLVEGRRWFGIGLQT